MRERAGADNKPLPLSLSRWLLKQRVMRCFVSVAMCLLAVVRVAKSAQICSTTGNNYCRCTIAGDNDLTLDLRHIGIKYPAENEVGDYVYSYTPCGLRDCGKSSGVLCQDATGKELEFSLGTYQEFSWQVTNDDPESLEFQIHYNGGEQDKGIKRRAVVHFLKTSGKPSFSFSQEDFPNYYFNVTGSGIAPYRPTGGSADISGPIGLTIIFLALAGLVAYFVIGGIFMYVKRGARGMEVIPNLAFWKDLPFLVKDGFKLTISPCHKRTGSYHGL